ncbi:MAG: HpcH/HpaI aldolase/citrate lyase family protein [Sedimentisphaeraceae bacterium JB056]
MGTQNPVRQALLERKVTLGTWIQIGHPAVSETLCNTAYDWIAADGEHTDITIDSFSNIMRGMYGRGPVPLIRVRENDTLVIRQALDMGAMGVIVPLVSTPEQARKAVSAAKYPPQGERGFCFSRMNDYGEKFNEYLTTANDDIAVVVMIESKEAIENIDEILAVDGVDGVFIGPYDLSGSYNIPGQTSHPLVNEGCRKVLDACKRAGKSAGLHVVIPTDESIKKAISDGFTFIAIGVDTVFINEASKKAFAVAKDAVSDFKS